MKWLRELLHVIFFKKMGNGTASEWVKGEDGNPVCVQRQDGFTQYEPRFW